MDEPDALRALARDLLIELVIENDTLRRLVCSMAAAVPAQCMAGDEAEMLTRVLDQWGTR